MVAEGRIAIEVRDAVKRFGAVTALAGVSLTIRDNEFFTLLGPSGCGKTTLLRLIAGFEEITEGEILLYGEDIGTLPPNKRPINTVFQHYALFPHMTVAENVAFGMRRLALERQDDIEARTGRILDLVKLSELAARRPAQLSGGQQQRVALAQGDGAAAEGAPARRAAVCARPQAATGDAHRAQADPEGHRHHLRLRDARPGGSAHDVGPHRRHVGGRDPAGGDAARHLRGARRPLRGGFHRGDQCPRGDGGAGAQRLPAIAVWRTVPGSRATRKRRPRTAPSRMC